MVLDDPEPPMKTILSLLSLLILFPHSAPAADLYQSKEFFSQTYTIDRKYKSMEGPQSAQRVLLLEGQSAELLWITAVRTEMVAADGMTPLPPEFMCHVNLDLDSAYHKALLGWDKNVNARILTLSQGQLEARFPEGFGIPILSTEPLVLITQVLNHNLEKPNLQVRHKVTVEFVRDCDLAAPLKPLFNTAVYGMALVQGRDGHFGQGQAAADTADHGIGCLPGTQAPNAMSGSEYDDGFGRKFTGHWVVKPGREVNHTNVSKLMNLPFDTTLHYAAVHLHPFAKSLELRDLTTGETLFKSRASGPKRGVGLTRVDVFSSETGIPVFKNHEYELASVYDNTSPVNQDSMAVMYLCVLDKEFRTPDAGMLQRNVSSSGTADASRVPRKDPRLILRASTGVMVFQLLPELAPQTVAQITKLVRAGAYDGIDFSRVEPGFVAQISRVSDPPGHLTEEQRSLLRKIPLEASGISHRRGVLSMAREDQDPNSAESSFSILLGDASHLDGKYTVFGRIESGVNELDAIETVARYNKGVPPANRIPLKIVKAEVIEAPR